MKSEMAETIRVLIQQFIHENHDSSAMKNLQNIAAKHDLLPLVFAWDPICIVPDGTVISMIWDNLDDRKVETDLRLVNMALFQGTRKYPQLENLRPIRSENDIECQYCGGTGVDPIAREINQTENIICYCGGLGWIPKEN
ncbi:MAG: hypothetical protein WKF92_08240 [Pyrinomonadaceae bacterium]